MQQIDGKIFRSTHDGQAVSFFVTDPNDVIQAHHNRGRFYELEELAIIGRHFPPGGLFLDIGANVGNHTVFAVKFLHARDVVVIEPNPPAILVLEANVDLNGIRRSVDLSHIGLGLSDEVAVATAVSDQGNLGATRLVSRQGDDGIRVLPGDDLFGGRRFDFIKIDVEGMELRVLNGLRQTVANSRPAMFIEVDDANAAAFAAFLDEVDYRVAERFRRYANNENYLVEPVERTG